jgi:hypothetical protein
LEAGGTLANPLNIDYNKLEPESDEDVTLRRRSAKDKSSIPRSPVADVTLPPIVVAGCSIVVSSFQREFIS